MVKYDFQFVGLDMNVRLDAFSLFDQSRATEVDEAAEQPTGDVNPAWSETTEFEQRRRVRPSSGLTF